MSTEEATVKVLQEWDLFDIVLEQIDRFVQLHGSRPEIILINKNLKPAFSIYLIRTLGLGPGEAIQEPFWINTVPVIFSKDINDAYIVCRSFSANFQELI